MRTDDAICVNSKKRRNRSTLRAGESMKRHGLQRPGKVARFSIGERPSPSFPSPPTPSASPAALDNSTLNTASSSPSLSPTSSASAQPEPARCPRAAALADRFSNHTQSVRAPVQLLTSPRATPTPPLSVSLRLPLRSEHRHVRSPRKWPAYIPKPVQHARSGTLFHQYSPCRTRQ